MTKKTVQPDFNWDKYEDWNGKTLKANPAIKNTNEDSVIYSREPYTEQLLSLYNEPQNVFIKKDLTKSELVTIIDIVNFPDDKHMVVELEGGLTVEIDLEKEKKFISLFGFESITDFINSLITLDARKDFISSGFYGFILEAYPSIKLSLIKGHTSKTEVVFMQEIKEPTQAYVAKVIETNRGGFFVDIQGIRAFMPGSLAAPNKIFNFQSYLGKEVIVMIEDYLQEMKSFIVSHKKYIDHVLPTRLKELDLSKKFTGSITGTSKIGIFVEFDDIFTGLLHTSKMSTETKKDFFNRVFKSGMEIEFWIDEITKDKRIILTEEDPAAKQEKLNEFLISSKDKPITGKIINILPAGIILKTGDFIGMIPSKEYKKKNRIFERGEELELSLLEVKDNGRILYNFW